MQRARNAVPWVLGAALVGATAYLCFRSGGFFSHPRGVIAAGAWVALAVAVAVAPACAWPRRGGLALLAVGSLAGLAALTALSVSWAPLEEAAREDAVRVALYAGVLPLAVLAFGQRKVARGLDPALAGLAAVVVSYGLLGKAGVLDLTTSALADGRLEQPLSYWNGMGAIAAVGIVLAARVAIDRTRPGAMRAIAAVLLAPLAAGLYLSYSRGALAAALAGLLLLALVAPEARGARRRLGVRGRAVAAGVAVLAVAAGLVIAASDQAAPPARGASAERFGDLGSNRADYWKVALGTFADNPLAGAGTASFRAEWLREREIDESVSDAHSLPLETGAELGLAGLLLLGGLVGSVAVAARRLARADEVLAPGPVAALATLGLHSMLDWDWELPGLFLFGVLLAGAVLAQSGRARPASAP